MTEQWLPVVGYEGIYEISDLGNTLSVGRYIAAKRGSQRWQAPRILSPGRLPTGHLTVRLFENGSGRSYSVHRLVLLAFIGEPPPGHEACHNNGDPSDNRLSNLRWDNRSANVIDQVRHGTHHKAKLTHCPRNHRLTEPNIYRYGNIRVCKTCAKDNSKTYHQRRKSA